MGFPRSMAYLREIHAGVEGPLMSDFNSSTLEAILPWARGEDPEIADMIEDELAFRAIP